MGVNDRTQEGGQLKQINDKKNPSSQDEEGQFVFVELQTKERKETLGNQSFLSTIIMPCFND